MKLLFILLCVPLIGFWTKNVIVVGADLKSNFFDFEPNIGVFISREYIEGTGLLFSSTNSLSQTNEQITLSPHIRFMIKICSIL